MIHSEILIVLLQVSFYFKSKGEKQKQLSTIYPINILLGA